MILNFDTSGNTGVRYEASNATGTMPKGWSVWFMTTDKFDQLLNLKQRNRISGMGVLREGTPTNEEVINAIVGLVEKSRLKENQDLGIKVAKIQVEEEWKEPLLKTLADKFQMEPLDENLPSTEKKQ